MKKEIILFLENVRSQHNVGSLFRTADAFGVTRIVLAGYTPTPVDRFGRKVKDIEKTSLGATEMVPWEQASDAVGAVVTLKEAGYTILVLEQDIRSVSLASFCTPERFVLVLGNEVEGVSESLRTLADAIIEIPMLGAKESLNVSVAGGIALYCSINMRIHR